LDTAIVTPLREKVTFASLADLADTMRDEAIVTARQTLAETQRKADLATLLRIPSFLGNFKYGLVSGVAGALAANDQRVRAVYTYDPGLNADSEVGEEMPLDMTLHLLVLVEAPSAALEAFIEALDRALTESLKGLPAPRFAQREFTLDTSLITEQDVQHGLGPAGLLSAVFTPPIKVWQREA
jgi:hypothetical protein